MQKIKSNESGRSMVEMLGVLAVIGVLTIIGITAFRYALNRHYANDLLHEVHRVAYSYSGHLLTAGNGAAFDVNSVEPAAADVSFTITPYDDYFMIGTEGIDKAVCDQAAGTELPVSFQRRAYCDEGAIEFYFANDMGACDDAEKCALPEICTAEQQVCGRSCCEAGETCMTGRCCPSGKYIAATNTCCEGDEVAYDTTGQGDYTCKEPETGDNCMGANGPDQSKCKLSGEEKLYCKVTDSINCVPSTATCQKLPTYNPQELMLGGKVTMGEWVKADEKLNWWNAKTFCEQLDMTLPSKMSLCHYEGTSNIYGVCVNSPTARIVQATFQYGDNQETIYLMDETSCAAWRAGKNSDGWFLNRTKYQKGAEMSVVCQPKNYEEPQCPTGERYDIDTDECFCNQTTCDFADSTSSNYCTKVTYLQSSKSQYIDLGHLTLSTEAEITVRGEFQSGEESWGNGSFNSFSSSDKSITLGVYTNRGTSGFGYNGDVGCWTSTTKAELGMSGSFGTVYTIKQNKEGIYVDGVLKQTWSCTPTEILNDQNFGVFGSPSAANLNNKGTARIYSFKITDNGQSIVDLVPVRTSCNIPAMYDEVSKTIFYKQGAGHLTTP